MGKRIQRVDIDKMNTKMLELGYQDENIHTQVQIDCSSVLWDYPDATAKMTVQAPNGEKYPVVPELADNVVVWDVTDSDLVYAGSGKIQLTLKNGTEVIKSASCSTRIMESITTTGPAPTPLENWMQRAEETAEQIAETAAETVLDDYGQVKEDVTGLKSALSSAIEVETITSLNLLDLSAVTHGKYIAQNGTEYTSASYGYTDYIAVEEGETYTLQTGTDATFETRSIKQMRFITAYDNSKAVMSSAGTESVPSYTVPNGVAFLRISVSDAYLTSGTYPVIYKGSALVPYIEYFAPYKQGTIKAEAYNKQYINEVIKEYIPKGLRYKFNLNNNYYQFDDDIQDMQDYTIAFRGTISSFVNLTIHRGYNETYGGRIYITNTDVNVYLGASTTVLSAQHGLTIKDYIFVVLTARNNNTASLKIYTNGGSYIKDVFSWDCRKGKLMGATSTSGGSVINDCELSYFCDGYISDTQLYGDSYFSSAHTNRWTSYLNSSGYTNFLLNGFPGRNSATALTSLKQVLECSNPKRIVWCLGMNDGDDNGGIDVSWKACVEEVMQICTERAIELILATIPNVPTIDHSAKNAYVIASGYRYIDFASAVGALNDTTWFDGMLDDGVHPTVQGAIALFTQALADVPELIQ